MLEKIKILEQIEVRANGVIFVKELNQILEDGVIISSIPHRSSFCPLDDVSKHEYQMVRDVAKVIWSDEIKKAYMEVQNAIK